MRLLKCDVTACKDLVGEDGEGILEERGDKKGGIAYWLSHDAETISAFSGGGEAEERLAASKGMTEIK